jgi:hypothetical protein
MEQCLHGLVLEQMLLNDRADIGGLDTAVPGVIVDHPHGDTHIALTLALASDRLERRLVCCLRHKFGQDRS